MPSVDEPQVCRHFGRCGGCSRLDEPITEQLAAKQRRAATLLAPFLDGVEPQITLPPRAPRHDRTTILYPAQLIDRQLQLGIYRTGSHDIEPIVDCRIQGKALTQLGVRVGELLRQLRLTTYLEATGNGLVRGFRARFMPGTNELLFGLIVTRPEFSERNALVRGLRQVSEDLRDEQGRPLRTVGIVLNVNPTAGNVLLGPTTLPLFGQTFQTDRIGELTFQVSFGSFYQLHRHAEAILFRPALAMLGDLRGLRVVDGYGGVGTFGCRLGQAGAASVTLIESSASSAADARTNFAANRTPGEVREEPFGNSPLPPCDLAVVDPPRSGLQEAGASALLATRPPRLLLVSCALESLARDLSHLHADYRVADLRLCDLFPHTEHIEALTLLQRRER